MKGVGCRVKGVVFRVSIQMKEVAHQNERVANVTKLQVCEDSRYIHYTDTLQVMIPVRIPGRMPGACVLHASAPP